MDPFGVPKEPGPPTTGSGSAPPALHHLLAKYGILGLPQVLRSPAVTAEITMPMPLTCRGRALQERIKMPSQHKLVFLVHVVRMQSYAKFQSNGPLWKWFRRPTKSSVPQPIRKLPDNAEPSPDARAVAR